MLKKLKVRHKITILAAMLILVIILVGFLGRVYTEKSNSHFRDMYNVDLQAIMLTDDLRLQARSTQYAMSKYILINDSLEQEALLSEIETKIENMQNDIAGYKELKLSEEELNSIIEIEKLYESNIKDIKTIFEKQLISSKSDSTVLQDYVISTCNKLESFRSLANALMKTHTAKVESNYLHIEKEIKIEMIVLMILVFIAVNIGILFTIILVKSITKGLKLAEKHINLLAMGDFTTEIDKKNLKSKDDIGDMLRALNKMQVSVKDLLLSVIEESSNISNLVKETEEHMLDLSSNSQEVSATTEELSAAMEEIAASTEEINASSTGVYSTIEQLNKKAKDSADTSTSISERAKNTKENAIKSEKKAIDIYNLANKNLREAIEKSKAVEQINDLLTSVLDVASQTNLLSLNASIEAARAGDAGRGFAVVAHEIGKLAEVSTRTVTKIQEVTDIVLDSVNNLKLSSNDLLEFVDKQVTKDYRLMVSIGEQYNQDAKELHDLSTEFSNATEKLESALSIITNSMKEISLTTNQGVEGTTDIAAKTSSVANMVTGVTEQTKLAQGSVETLLTLVDKFKI